MSLTSRTTASRSVLPLSSSIRSSSKLTSKWSSIEFLPRPVTMMMLSMPESSASSTPYWIMGLSTSGSISLGCALVAGRKRVPSPAAGNTALRTLRMMAGGIVDDRSDSNKGDGRDCRPPALPRLTSLSPACGCAAKLGPQILDAVLPLLRRAADPNLIVGFEGAEDAAIYQLAPDLALVQTVGFPPRQPPELLRRILQGGIDKLAEAGCALGGGHSVRDEELKFGFSVTGR